MPFNLVPTVEMLRYIMLVTQKSMIYDEINVLSMHAYNHIIWKRNLELLLTNLLYLIGEDTEAQTVKVVKISQN